MTKDYTNYLPPFSQHYVQLADDDPKEFHLGERVINVNQGIDAKTENETFMTRFCGSLLVTENSLITIIGALAVLPYLDGAQEENYIYLASAGAGASAASVLGLFILSALACKYLKDQFLVSGFLAPVAQLLLPLLLLYAELNQDHLPYFRVACSAAAGVGVLGGLLFSYQWFRHVRTGHEEAGESRGPHSRV